MREEVCAKLHVSACAYNKKLYLKNNQFKFKIIIIIYLGFCQPCSNAHICATYINICIIFLYVILHMTYCNLDILHIMKCNITSYMIKMPHISYNLAIYLAPLAIHPQGAAITKKYHYYYFFLRL